MGFPFYLGVFNLKDNIVIIGSSSDLAEEFKNVCLQNNHRIFTVSRKNNSKKNHLCVNDYLDDSEEIYKFCKNNSNLVIVFFNGFLRENRPLENPNRYEINQTDFVNFQVPYNLTLKLNSLSNIKKFVYISSIAAVNTRRKNYIYGLSKFKLEKAVSFLNSNSYLLIRFGKIKTKMSEQHKDPPFTLSKEKAAKILYKKLNNSGIVYGNLGLMVVGNILKIIPRRIILLFNF